MPTTSDERVPDPVQETLELPEHAGRKPAGMKTALRGAGNRVTRPHEIGERVVFVVEAIVDDVGHKHVKREGLLYHEKFAALDLFELDVTAGRDLLVGLRQKERVADDLKHGRSPLFEEHKAVTPKIVWADESGYVLTDVELAAIQGVPPVESDEERDARLAAEEAAALEEEAAGDADAHRQLMSPRWLRAVADDDTKGYDALTAAQVIESVRFVDEAAGVDALAKWEAANKNRKSVMAAFESRRSELFG